MKGNGNTEEIVFGSGLREGKPLEGERMGSRGLWPLWEGRKEEGKEGRKEGSKRRKQVGK